MPSKKITLVTSGIAVVIFLILDHIGTFKLCGGQVYGQCMDRLHTDFGYFIPILPFFLFALITYFMRDEVYKTWVRVALGWLVISMILIAITPDATSGGFGPQLSFGKSDTALLTSALSIIISLVVIIWKYWKLSKKR